MESITVHLDQYGETSSLLSFETTVLLESITYPRACIVKIGHMGLLKKGLTNPEDCGNFAHDYVSGRLCRGRQKEPGFLCGVA